MKKKGQKHVIWPDDPVVEEVRAVRAKLWKKAGGTVTGFLELARQKTQQLEQNSRARKTLKRSTQGR